MLPQVLLQPNMPLTAIQQQALAPTWQYLNMGPQVLFQPNMPLMDIQQLQDTFQAFQERFENLPLMTNPKGLQWRGHSC